MLVAALDALGHKLCFPHPPTEVKPALWLPLSELPLSDPCVTSDPLACFLGVRVWEKTQ